MARIRHLALRCRDMEESRRFYESVFGWKCIGYRSSRQGMDLTDGVTNITLLQQPADCDRPRIEEAASTSISASWWRTWRPPGIAAANGAPRPPRPSRTASIWTAAGCPIAPSRSKTPTATWWT